MSGGSCDGLRYFRRVVKFTLYPSCWHIDTYSFSISFTSTSRKWGSNSKEAILCHVSLRYRDSVSSILDFAINFCLGESAWKVVFSDECEKARLQSSWRMCLENASQNLFQIQVKDPCLKAVHLRYGRKPNNNPAWKGNIYHMYI